MDKTITWTGAVIDIPVSDEADARFRAATEDERAGLARLLQARASAACAVAVGEWLDALGGGTDDGREEGAE